MQSRNNMSDKLNIEVLDDSLSTGDNVIVVFGKTEIYLSQEETKELILKLLKYAGDNITLKFS